MRPQAFALLVDKEFSDAVRSRWLAAFTGGFVVLGLGLLWLGSWSSSLGGFLGFGPASAALLNLVLLLVPLTALIAGSLSVSSERERGTLAFLLSLPLHPREVFWAKFAGLNLAFFSALGTAFGVLGGVLAWRGGLGSLSVYARFFAATLLLCTSCLGVGFLISVLTRRSMQAVGAAVLAWLALVLGGDLGLMGAAIATRMPPGGLLAAAWLNPLSLYRLFAIDTTASGLDALGPAGQCAQDVLGHWLAPAALGGIVAWALIAVLVAYRSYRRRPLGAKA
ncbi:MAG: ABC transporter permease [Elusimicrobia bacterium]|nr:ABC transporter permease [Elusimicrobiota bacterium]